MNCLKCNNEVDYPVNFKTLGEEINCSNCGNAMLIDYDYCYDEEGGEDGWFFFTQIEDNN